MVGTSTTGFGDVGYGDVGFGDHRVAFVPHRDGVVARAGTDQQTHDGEDEHGRLIGTGGTVQTPNQRLPVGNVQPVLTVKDLAELYPERFSNKTNGVTPRRWLLMSNPALSQTITDAIGDGWITDLGQLSKLKKLAEGG